MASVTKTQRANLLKLAAYLESLPRNYQHFDMANYVDHRGACVLPMQKDVFAAKAPEQFLTNCGTVACAVGHGPAAGIRPLKREFERNGFDWIGYGDRTFTNNNDDFEFMFGSSWNQHDNHHYGAAARIRYFLEYGLPDEFEDGEFPDQHHYASFRKGSRSAKRREIDALVSA